MSLKDEIKKQISEARKTVALMNAKKIRPGVMARMFAPIKETLDVLSTEFSYNSRFTFNASLTELLDGLAKYNSRRPAKVGYCRSYEAPNDCLYYVKSQSECYLFVYTISCCGRFFSMHVDEYSDAVSGQIFTSDYTEGEKSKWLKHLTHMLADAEALLLYYENNGVS